MSASLIEQIQMLQSIDLPEVGRGSSAEICSTPLMARLEAIISTVAPADAPESEKQLIRRIARDRLVDTDKQCPYTALMLACSIPVVEKSLLGTGFALPANVMFATSRVAQIGGIVLNDEEGNSAIVIDEMAIYASHMLQSILLPFFFDPMLGSALIPNEIFRSRISKSRDALSDFGISIMYMLSKLSPVAGAWSNADKLKFSAGALAGETLRFLILHELCHIFCNHHLRTNIDIISDDGLDKICSFIAISHGENPSSINRARVKEMLVLQAKEIEADTIATEIMLRSVSNPDLAMLAVIFHFRLHELIYKMLSCWRHKARVEPRLGRNVGWKRSLLRFSSHPYPTFRLNKIFRYLQELEHFDCRHEWIATDRRLQIIFTLAYQDIEPKLIEFAKEQDVHRAWSYVFSGWHAPI